LLQFEFITLCQRTIFIEETGERRKGEDTINYILRKKRKQKGTRPQGTSSKRILCPSTLLPF